MSKVAPSAAAHVLLVDSNRTRLHAIATAFRAAGCVVVETSQERDVYRCLTAVKPQPWVLAIADSMKMLTPAFHAAHPTVPIVAIGGQHRDSIAGRITIERSPELGAEVHGLVLSREYAS